MERNASNTYQLAMMTNSQDSYALFAYNRIEWAQSQGRYAQVGFFSVDERNEKLINSGTQNVSDLLSITNFNEPGLFIYKISGSNPLGMLSRLPPTTRHLDPRYESSNLGEDEYEYQTEQEEYDQEDQIGGCPQHFLIWLLFSCMPI